MIIRIDGDSVDRCGGNQRVVGHDGPGGGSAAAVGRFPHSATDRARIGHYAAVRRGGRIDRNGVDSSFSLCVVKTTGTTRHPHRLRTKCGKIGRTQRVWIGEIKLQVLSRRYAARHPCMLSCGRAHPRGVKAPGRKCQTIVPVLFQLLQTGSFAL